ncbi:hypothetical protein HQ584_13070 [Patescibacteria group bacterium]|nr:hypothetical protein [Patescibacteria group bacterium]
MRKDYVELNESVSFANGGTELADLNEGDIYKLRNSIKYSKWRLTQINAQQWIRNHFVIVKKFKEKFGFSTLEK